MSARRPARTEAEMAVERGILIADRAVRAARTGDIAAVERATDDLGEGELRVLVSILAFAYASAAAAAADVRSALVVAQAIDRRRASIPRQGEG